MVNSYIRQAGRPWRQARGQGSEVRVGVEEAEAAYKRRGEQVAAVEASSSKLLPHTATKQ